MKKIIKIIDFIISLTGIIASIFIFLTCFIVTWGIIARYFHISAYWVEPTTIYMFIAISFLTISSTMRANEHVRVDILTSKLPKQAAKILDTCLMLFCVVFFTFVTVVTYDMFLNSWTLKTKDLSILQVPIWIPQLFVVIGWCVFILSILRYIWSIWFEEAPINEEQLVGED